MACCRPAPAAAGDCGQPNSTIRRNFGSNNQFNEQRLIVQYPLPLF
ncbi:hypothetical protein [Azotobacter beijerinckii]|nr:hypothetical protein [Azotobacter beijerinckii]MDV7211535.1 hypothetical protein [Azotobacter beijerinckii]